MLVKTFPVGQIETNCYIVTDEETLECAIIDPGDESNVILNYIEEMKLTPRAILLTHGHYDHTMAVGDIVLEQGVPVYIHRADTAPDNKPSPYQYMPDSSTHFYADGDVVEAGPLKFTVMETPGHSPGSVTLRCGNCLFSGDTLFRDSCGRTDLPGGDMDTLMESLRRLGRLEGDFEVYPGHMDASTLDRERRFNYYIKYAISGGQD